MSGPLIRSDPPYVGNDPHSRKCANEHRQLDRLLQLVVRYTVLSWAPVYLTLAGLSLAWAIQSIFLHNVAAIIGSLVVAAGINRWGSKRTLTIQLFGGTPIVGSIGFLLVSGLAAQSSTAAAIVMVAMTGLGAMIGSTWRPCTSCWQPATRWRFVQRDWVSVFP